MTVSKKMISDFCNSNRTNGMTGRKDIVSEHNDTHLHAHVISNNSRFQDSLDVDN
eukprot:CAMPEP_0184503790 /NCGR_PEP_ID=MMETSP0113_2-20130426/52097_1 /TAXON_ID=91329 /ORGANISM="Norrisiella sphaerica, Strain BC52" /LENGTH=54 /DNA_ID=CAMNT_0026893347 /DNA_START=573 /DNA_END=737 /DNA_ORIENTATION=-